MKFLTSVQKLIHNACRFLPNRGIEIFILLLSFMFSFGINELNRQELLRAHPNKLRFNATVVTNDDASYLRPPQNFLAGKGWCSNEIGVQKFFSRPPGYGLFCLPVFACVKNDYAVYRIIFLLQVILFSISVVFLYRMGNLLVFKKQIRWLLVVLYGLFPIASGFLNYTLTEGITPALLIFFFYSLLRAKSVQYKFINNMVCAFIFAIIFIVRPVLGLFILAFPMAIFLSNQSWKKKFGKTAFFLFVALLPMVLWLFRSYQLTDKYVGLHPIYYEQSNSQYRPTHDAIWQFYECWATEGSAWHSFMNPIWENGIKGDTSYKWIQPAIDAIPANVTNEIGKSNIVNAFRLYQISILEQKIFYENQLSMPAHLSTHEIHVIDNFKLFRKQYIQMHPAMFYVIAPLKVLQKMTLHSNLNLYIFQQTYRSYFLMEMIRLISYCIHFLAFVSLLLIAFFPRANAILRIMALISIVYLFYLAFVQRGVEERYTLPILFMGVLSLLAIINNKLLQKTT